MRAIGSRRGSDQRSEVAHATATLLFAATHVPESRA